MLPFIVLACSSALAAEEDLDSNTAFYEGETLNYILVPPPQFRMVGREAASDGYSFAFVPIGCEYDSTDVLIGVNIFKIRGLACDRVIEQDTATLREHYGADLDLREIPEISVASGQVTRTFYLNSEDRFIPNVMIAYLDCLTEILIFELVITESTLRVKAEEQFVECLRATRAMPKGTLGMR